MLKLDMSAYSFVLKIQALPGRRTAFLRCNAKTIERPSHTMNPDTKNSVMNKPKLYAMKHNNVTSIAPFRNTDQTYFKSKFLILALIVFCILATECPSGFV